MIKWKTVKKLIFNYKFFSKLVHIAASAFAIIFCRMMKHFFVRIFMFLIIFMHSQDGTAEKTTTQSFCPTRPFTDLRGPPGIPGTSKITVGGKMWLLSSERTEF